jgi:hypothetical protein
MARVQDVAGNQQTPPPRVEALRALGQHDRLALSLHWRGGPRIRRQANWVAAWAIYPSLQSDSDDAVCECAVALSRRAGGRAGRR